MRSEFSAGGIVQEDGKILMVKVKNLEGRQIWTFPKGHLEPGETAEQAAVREVEEETGYQCAIARPFEHVQYFFQRGQERINKEVTWFLMTPIKKTGVHDPDEIMETEWVTLPEAKARVQYKSDHQLLAKLI